jgi:hypothetical protein
MEESLRKTTESHYEVVVDGKTIGEVWNWHGSWSAQKPGARLATASKAGRKRWSGSTS